MKKEKEKEKEKGEDKEKGGAREGNLDNERVGNRGENISLLSGISGVICFHQKTFF